MITAMQRPVTLLIPLLLIVCASGAFASHQQESAPPFTLPTGSGTVSPESLQGKVVYVDFWASWCIPCRQSFPWMATMAGKYGAKGFAVVAINLDKSREAADAFLAKYPPSFTVAFDPAGKTAEQFGVRAMPSSFLIDRNGKIVWSHEGFQPSRAQAMEERIAEELSR